MKKIVLGLVLFFASNAFSATKFPNLAQVMSDIELSIELMDQGNLAEAEKVLATLVLPQTRAWGKAFDEEGSGFIHVLLQQEQSIYKMSMAQIEAAKNELFEVLAHIGSLEQ